MQITALLLICGLSLCAAENEEHKTADVVVYGGTSGGVAAAVQAARMGHSAILIEPGQHLGGMSSAGLGATDFGNKQAIGGIAREFYQRIRRHYASPNAWIHESLDDYRRRAGHYIDDDCMWAFEPHVAENVFREMLAQAGVTVILGQRLSLHKGVRKDDRRIIAILTESGQVFTAKVFIDATYEGDLMAAAGVSYTVGRESNAMYAETLNGVQARNAVKHQFLMPIDPYIEPGRPESGLLPGVHDGGPGNDGEGDHRVQAYNFRMCLTDVPANRLPFPKPDGYDPRRYELLLRYLEAGCTEVPWDNSPMPNRKTDTNNNGAFSTDNIGANYDYPNGDYATRERIAADHRQYQLGLMWTLANHPRVPEKIRAEVSRWGLAKDEFADNGNWPYQLYVRESRRMVSDYIMTEHHCRGAVRAEDSVALAAYTMDSHNVQRYVDAQGHARNEGDVQAGGFPPYPISYRSIVPKNTECDNLLTPICLSASHIAYGSIRMEPVFMVLGQSAATAACLALRGDLAVQDVDYALLREKLLQDGQVLSWPTTN